MVPELKRYVIDACGLIAYLRGEEGGSRLADDFKSGYEFYLHAVTLGEIYYDSIRVGGVDCANALVEDVFKLPVEVIWNIDLSLIRLVGKFKTSFRISYADAFVLALASQKQASVITTDHHEFESVETAGPIKFHWLR
jgi:uncharacterized protein